MVPLKDATPEDRMLRALLVIESLVSEEVKFLGGRIGKLIDEIYMVSHAATGKRSAGRIRDRFFERQEELEESLKLSGVVDIENVMDKIQKKGKCNE